MANSKRNFKTIEEIDANSEYLLSLLNKSLEESAEKTSDPSVKRLLFDGVLCDGTSDDMNFAHQRIRQPPPTPAEGFKPVTLNSSSMNYNLDLESRILTKSVDEAKAKELTQYATDMKSFLYETSLDRYANNEPPIGSEEYKKMEFMKSMVRNCEDFKSYLINRKKYDFPHRCRSRAAVIEQLRQSLASPSEHPDPDDYIKVLDATSAIIQDKLHELRQARIEDGLFYDPKDSTSESTFPTSVIGPKGEILVPQFSCDGDFHQGEVTGVVKIPHIGVHTATDAIKPNSHPSEELPIPIPSKEKFMPPASEPPKHKQLTGCDVDSKDPPYAISKGKSSRSTSYHFDEARYQKQKERLFKQAAAASLSSKDAKQSETKDSVRNHKVRLHKKVSTEDIKKNMSSTSPVCSNSIERVRGRCQPMKVMSTDVCPAYMILAKELGKSKNKKKNFGIYPIPKPDPDKNDSFEQTAVRPSSMSSSTMKNDLECPKDSITSASPRMVQTSPKPKAKEIGKISAKPKSCTRSHEILKISPPEDNPGEQTLARPSTTPLSSTTKIDLKGYGKNTTMTKPRTSPAIPNVSPKPPIAQSENMVKSPVRLTAREMKIISSRLKKERKEQSAITKSLLKMTKENGEKKSGPSCETPSGDTDKSSEKNMY